MVEKVKLLVGLTGTTEHDELIEEIVTLVDERVCAYIGLDYTPSDLEWIVKEISCARYNTIGSEGVHSEQNEGIKYIYIDNMLDPYREYLDRYIETHHLRKRGFRMI